MKKFKVIEKSRFCQEMAEIKGGFSCDRRSPFGACAGMDKYLMCGVVTAIPTFYSCNGMYCSLFEQSCGGSIQYSFTCGGSRPDYVSDSFHIL